MQTQYRLLETRRLSRCGTWRILPDRQCTVFNTRDLYTYLSVPADSLHETAAQITRNEQMEEFMFLGLRMRDGFYRDEFTQAFGIPIEAVYGVVPPSSSPPM